MSNEEFRRELNSVFDDVSGSPSSNLPDRVRSAIANPPEVRGPYWIAAVAAAVIAVLIIGVFYVAGPLKPPSTVGGAHPTPSPTLTATPTSDTTPSSLPAFVCQTETVTSTYTPPPPTVFVSDMRTGTHSGYDRVTITLSNGLPHEAGAQPQSNTVFTLSPRGDQVTLKGKSGLLFNTHGADMHTSYNGSRDLVTGYPVLAEVRVVQDFEGVVQIAIGTSGTGCYRVFFLANPDRIVIDVQANG